MEGMDSRQLASLPRPRARQQRGGSSFVCSDGSVLNNLPSDMMITPGAIGTLDQGLANPCNLSPHNKASTPSTTITTVVSPSLPPLPPSASSSSATPAAAKAAASALVARGAGGGGAAIAQLAPIPITLFGEEMEFQELFLDDRSERCYTDEYRTDHLESDGDASDGLVESLTVEGSKMPGGGGGDVAGHDADDEEEPDAGAETKAAPGPTGAGGKKKKSDRKRPRDGEGTEEQRQKASRDRNREHARNTRMRKKQFVENLKIQVEEMMQLNAREERDALLISSNESSDKESRRQMMLTMFYLRATEDLSPQAWTAILADGFTCITPLTPFRSFHPSEARDDHRLITGIDGMIQDTASLAVFFQSICPRSRNPTGKKVNYQFYTSLDTTVVDTSVAMCRWLLRTDNAVECGAMNEVFSHGLMKACFTPDNQIKHMEIMFDVMSFMQRLQRAMGSGGFRVVPNTVEAAMQPSPQARLVCSAEPPYWITHTNEAWTVLTGHSPQEAKLFSVTLMNGPAEANNGGDLDALVHKCVGSSLKRAAMADLHVLTRDMRRLSLAVRGYPLGTAEGETTHLLLVMEEVPVCATVPQPGGLGIFPFV